MTVNTDDRIRSIYTSPPPDPLGLLADWLQQARDGGVREPGALALGTVGRDGRSSSRIVALLSAGPGGLVFSSHDGSRKATDIAETGWASGVLYWRETGQQITLAGPVRRMGEAESNELWYARPAATRPMSVASRQSDPLDDEEALRAQADRLAEEGGALPRPTTWSGYRIRPASIEFWTADPGRLHQRLHYELDGDRWTSWRLQP